MSRAANIWMPFYTSDYTRDTLHLTRDQHGGYILLLIACWNAGGRLPNNAGTLAGITKSTPAEWRKLAPVLKRFFQIDGGDLTHKRVLEELAKAARLSQARRETGRLGGRPRKQPESERKPIAKLEGNLEGKQNETPARVTVNVSTAVDHHSPSQESAGTDSQALGAGQTVVPMAGRGRA